MDLFYKMLWRINQPPQTYPGDKFFCVFFRAYSALVSLNKNLLNPYFSGGYIGGWVWLKIAMKMDKPMGLVQDSRISIYSLLSHLEEKILDGFHQPW